MSHTGSENLNNNQTQSPNAHLYQETQWLSEGSLEEAIEAIEQEADSYQLAGFTQVSVWLG
jgi:hypothetical protein